MREPYELTPYNVSCLIRDELEKVLISPGVTWNKQGMLDAYDRAAARAAFRVAEIVVKSIQQEEV